MPRSPRNFQPGFCYHITTRCNNREFRLTRLECREVFLYAIKKAKEKYRFKLYALCIMSNHVHYLLEPAQSEELPKIMHWQPLWGSQKLKVKSQKLKVKNNYFKTIVR